MRNYASWAAIMTALRSPIISCLPLTHRYMSLCARYKFWRMSKVQPDSNNDYYRGALVQGESKGCIPWHGLYVLLRSGSSLILLSIDTDLVNISNIMREEQDVDNKNDPPLLNIEKWAHLEWLATSACKYQLPALDENPGYAIIYLQSRLQGITPGKDLDGYLKTKSDYLTDKEYILIKQDLDILRYVLGGTYKIKDH